MRESVRRHKQEQLGPLGAGAILGQGGLGARPRKLLVLQPDPTAGIDTYTDQTAADTNNATNVAIAMRGVSAQIRIGLIKFDVSSLANKTVISARLFFYNSATAAANRTFTVHPILVANSAWIESSTWNYRVPTTQRWAGDSAGDGGSDAGCSFAGTDYRTAASGTLTYLANDPANTEIATNLLPADVQAWIGGANYGLAIVAAAAQANFTFNSSDYVTDITKRPKLVVVYT